MNKQRITDDELEQVIAKVWTEKDYRPVYPNLGRASRNRLMDAARGVAEYALEVANEEVLFNRIDELREELHRANCTIEDREQINAKLATANRELREKWDWANTALAKRDKNAMKMAEEIAHLREKVERLEARLRKPRVRVKLDHRVNPELEKAAQKVVENLGLNASGRVVPMPRITCGTPGCPFCTEG